MRESADMSKHSVAHPVTVSYASRSDGRRKARAVFDSAGRAANAFWPNGTA